MVMLARTIADVVQINRTAGASRTNAEAVAMRSSKRIADNGNVSFLPARRAFEECLKSIQSG